VTHLIWPVPNLPVAKLLPENADYSASYTLTNKTLLFMKTKNVIKITIRDTQEGNFKRKA
jgi:hypothetical protein